MHSRVFPEKNSYPRCPNDFANVLSVFNIFIGVELTALTADSLRATISVCCSFLFLSSVLRASLEDSSGFTDETKIIRVLKIIKRGEDGPFILPERAEIFPGTMTCEGHGI